MLFLGIDTSAYTSSIALVNENKQLVFENRQLLDVASGERGLAQSEALFKHLQVLPELLNSIPRDLWQQIKGVGVSSAPRPVEGSYMPVFIAGKSIAVSLSSALGVPIFTSTHQEGHIAAGLASVEENIESEFLAVHISGGTTELLIVKKDELGRINIKKLGGSTDLHAGQFIDRIGVSMGLHFPAGRELERLALKASPGSASLLPSSVNGYDMSFSGVESAAQRMLADQKKPADIARAVEGCLVRTLVKVLEKALADTGLKTVLVVGGVAANKYLRTEINKKIGTKGKIFWAKTEWSSDNAIGVAILTAESINSN